MSATQFQAPGIDDLVGRYHSWLRDRTSLKTIRHWTEITTPFLDRHNDCIQIYARRDDSNGFTLTDDGHTIADLVISGCNLDSQKRKDLLHTAINGFGIRLVGEVLQVSATSDNFALRKHNLIQAILAVNDLFYLASSTVKSLFLEDVTAWLDQAGIRYVPHVKIPGISSFDHVFDFAIPKSQNSPERLLRTINNPNRDSAENFAFAWTDTQPARSPNAVAYAFVNDNERSLPPTVSDALTAYGIKSVIWSQRNAAMGVLAA